MNVTDSDYERSYFFRNRQNPGERLPHIESSILGESIPIYDRDDTCRVYHRQFYPVFCSGALIVMLCFTKQVDLFEYNDE